MRLADPHCHLQDRRFDEDREEVIARALDHLDWIVVIGDDLPNSRTAVVMARERVYASVGMHPYHAVDVDDAALEELRTLARSPSVKAYGEIGLDYFNEFSPRAAQQPAFARQLELACELGLPAVIHNRAADDDTLAILKPFLGRLPSCVMHCFGSDAAFAARCVELGLYVSFAGNLTFPKAQPLRDAARIVPLDRLLVETDAPYLAPQAVRGQRCEPHFVRYTAEALAAIKNVPRDEMTQQLALNAQHAFRLSPNGS